MYPVLAHVVPQSATGPSLPDVHTQQDAAVQELLGGAYRLMLYNDDHNTFDWVIKALIEICEHTTEQAEQCALFVHYKGKYAVKHGGKDDLRPRCTALLERGLSAKIV